MNSGKRITTLLFLFWMLFFILVHGRPASANPLININSENHDIYDLLEGSITSLAYSTSIRPMYNYGAAILAKHYQKVRLKLNVEDGSNFYFKPLNDVASQFYYTTEEQSFMEGGSGLSLSNGNNFFIYESGYLSVCRFFVIYFQLKQSFQAEEVKFDFYRAYGKIHFGKFSLEGGIDNINLGPGEYGLLLSDNVKPYPLIRLGTEEPINILGKWHLVFMNGWLIDERPDYSNPMLFAFRIAWKPINYLELGVTRTTLHGGIGRSDYKWWEYFDIFISSRGRKSPKRFDYDAMGAYDISLNLPFHKITEAMEITKLYFQVAGTDVLAPWTHEKKRAFQYGLFMSFLNNFVRFEFIDISSRFYTQYNYSSEDYTYKGLSLGHPYGSDCHIFQFKHRYYIFDFLSFEYRLGLVIQPYSQKNNRMERYFGSLLVEGHIWKFDIEAYFRYDSTENYDEDYLPTKFSVVNKDKSLYSFGVSVLMKL